MTNDQFQFQIIDALADNDSNLKSYSVKLKLFKTVSADLEHLISQKAESIKELDYNLFLLKELEEANLIDSELENLESEYETLNNVEDIKERLAHSHHLLNNDDLGIIANLNEIKTHISKITSFGKRYESIFERINSSIIELDDLVTELEDLESQLEADPNRLEAVNSKLRLLHNLLQKHSVSTVKELISIKTDLLQKVIVTEGLDADILSKEKEIEQLNSELLEVAEIIHKKRIKVLPDLTNQLGSILETLGMPNAKFNIVIQPTSVFLANGTDELQFLFSANKGMQYNDLKKAASGGELSRIMLAIKSILSKFTQLPTIMFDEIDTGVSGEISNKMATIMQNMSKSMQVFTITHLPQIAGKGDAHYKVYKEDINDVTQTRLKKLTDEERIVEIAQMLGGTKVSNSAIEHAKQLLN